MASLELAPSNLIDLWWSRKTVVRLEAPGGPYTFNVGVQSERPVIRLALHD